MEHDLGGHNALISKQFYYFGNKPQQLPSHLLGIVKQGQGHKSYANQLLLEPFVKWIEDLGFAVNQLHGQPQYWALNGYGDIQAGTIRSACAREDEVIEDHHGIC
jgi:hypothetical protein